MPRYSLNLRPRYAPDELTGGERISQSIGSALDSYMQEQDARRAERNQMAAAGARPMEGPADPGVMGRMRGIGSAIKRRFLGDDSGPSVMQTGLQTGTDMARDGFGASHISPPVMGAPTPEIDMKGRVRGTNNFPTATMAGSTPSMAAPPAAPGRPTFEQTPRGIGAALQPYTMEGRGGAKYSVDPLYGQRVATAGHEMEANATEARRTATENAQISAMVAAGMDEPTARAQVLTNTVRYGEEFGAYRRPPAQGMTQADRLQVEAVRQANRKNLEDARYQHAQALQSGNADAVRRAGLALQTAEFEYRKSEDRAKAFERTADDAARTVPTNPIDRSIAESTPEGRGRITTAESTAAANRDSAGRVRTGAAAIRPDDSAVGGRPKFTPDQTRARAQALKAQGKTKLEVYEMLKREGHNVAPPKEGIVLPPPGR